MVLLRKGGGERAKQKQNQEGDVGDQEHGSKQKGPAPNQFSLLLDDSDDDDDDDDDESGEEGGDANEDEEDEEDDERPRPCLPIERPKLMQLVEGMLERCEDADKVSCNAVRALGCFCMWLHPMVSEMSEGQ